MRNFRNLLITGLATIALFSCSSDDDAPAPVNEEETITIVTLTLTNANDASDVVIFRSFDADGDGPTAPVLSITDGTTGTPDVLAANATYNGVILIQNELETPAENVNEEIIEEKDEHFFVYTNNGLNVTLTREDTAANTRTDGNELGIDTQWVTGAASTGNLQVQLFHEPTTVDDSNEFGTVAGGEDEVNVTFTGVTIQ